MSREASTRTQRMHRDWQTPSVLAITWLAFGLRLFCLDHQSLWMDGATSAYLTTLPLAQIVLNRANGLHSLQNYMIVWMRWSRRAQNSTSVSREVIEE